jgi:hypothetical protein
MAAGAEDALYEIRRHASGSDVVPHVSALPPPPPLALPCFLPPRNPIAGALCSEEIARRVRGGLALFSTNFPEVPVFYFIFFFG